MIKNELVEEILEGVIQTLQDRCYSSRMGAIVLVVQTLGELLSAMLLLLEEEHQP